MRFLLSIPLAILAIGLLAQTEKDLNESYRTKEGRAGIAATLGSADRVERMRPAEIVAKLDLQPGMTVADLGTGVGMLLPELSRAVGPDGKVIAQDIFPDFLEKARANAKKHELGNVEFLLGAETDPKLPAGQVDLAVAIDAYHHFNQPDKMLRGIREGLKQNGRLAIIDYYRRPGAMPRGNALEHIRADRDEVVKEIEAAGFTLLSKAEHIPDSQYIVIFRRK